MAVTKFCTKIFYLYVGKVLTQKENNNKTEKYLKKEIKIKIVINK